MVSVNKVILIGNLGRDPDTRYTLAGMTVCTFSIATTRTWKSKDSGEKQEETEWHRIVAYDRLGEIASEYLSKGRPVYIEGRLKTRKWDDKDGTTRYTTEIVTEQIQLLGSKRDHDDADRPASTGPGDHPAHKKPAAAPAAKQAGAFDDMGDDIPF
jgi:single-strand DNA-binding protein